MFRCRFSFIIFFLLNVKTPTIRAKAQNLKDQTPEKCSLLPISPKLCVSIRARILVSHSASTATTLPASAPSSSSISSTRTCSPRLTSTLCWVTLRRRPLSSWVSFFFRRRWNGLPVFPRHDPSSLQTKLQRWPHCAIVVVVVAVAAVAATTIHRQDPPGMQPRMLLSVEATARLVGAVHLTIIMTTTTTTSQRPH